VAAGTYTPTLGVTRTATFHLIHGVALYGGFAMTETLRSQRDFTAHVTILSGDIGTPSDASDNAYHVVTGSGVTNTAVLDGFNLMGGKADGSYPLDAGGGMYNDGGSPTLTNVTFMSNTANSGGGMHNDNYSSPTLTNVTFMSNTAPWGGGLYNKNSSSPTLTNVTFMSNSAARYGGGMYNYYSSSPTLTNVTFVSNTASFGGGMGNYPYSDPTLTNVTFTGNSVTYSGGGMYNDLGSSPTLTNVTFSGNSAGYSGGGMYNYYSSNPTITNTILWGNIAPSGPQIYNSNGVPSLADSVVQGGYAAGTNIIDRDPLLGALGHWGGTTQTVPLLPGSSAIDAGNNATCALTDQRGLPRVGTCDIGAFEFQGYALNKVSGDQQSTRVNTTFANSLSVQLNELNSPLVFPGETITFTAPSSGASAAWSGSLVMTATTDESGEATVAPPTANGIGGSYGVTVAGPVPSTPLTFTLTNLKYDTTTVITSSQNPVPVSHPLTLTVTVSAVPPGSVLPTGTVELSETSPAGTAVRTARRAVASQPLVNGVATFSLPSLPAGIHTFLATYNGDANCNASSSAIYTQNVGALGYYLPLLRR
jgi:predicted outer membrane repeat protein